MLMTSYKNAVENDTFYEGNNHRVCGTKMDT